MAYPDIATLTNIFLPDGYGSFGFGDGGYGGGTDILNPQWNTNAGIYGLDPVSGLPFVAANGSPSYLGASTYSILDSAFFAQITPAGPGNGTITTAIVIKANANNYVEMSIGPNQQFNAYVANDKAIVTSSPSMPTYDPVAHAFWRIRNDGSQFYFDTAPDGATWTQQGSAPYNWDASAVTVTIFAGFTGIEDSGWIALINNVNLPNTTLALGGSTGATASVDGTYLVTSALTLSGQVTAKAGFKANFNVSLGIPQGGLTDWVYGNFVQQIDPLILGSLYDTNVLNVGNAGTITQAAWTRGAFPVSAPSPYRDGSYFQPAAYATINQLVNFVPDAGGTLMTNVQLEETTGLNNRLPLNASIFTDSCAYSPGFGVTTVQQSTEVALTGEYSAQMISAGSAITLGNGQLGYLPLPQRSAMTPVIQNVTDGTEVQFATVGLSTARANTNWFACFVFYDVNFNILSASTYQQSSITNINVHPGGNVWQIGAVQAGTALAPAIPTAAVYSSVVPCVIVPTSSLVETVYFSNNAIYGGSLWFTEAGTNYSSPRTANINVKADRVNYVVNGGFNTAVTYWAQTNVGTSGTPNPASISWDGTTGFQSVGSMKFSTNAISGSFTGTSTSRLGVSANTKWSGSNIPVVSGLTPGNTYTISAWIKQSANCPDVYMNFYDGNFNGVENISTNLTKADSPQNISGSWTRIQATYTVPPNGLQDYGMFFFVNFLDMAHAPFQFWVDAILVEETTQYNGFFDGGFASSDYQWESGGAANTSRSYYYKDYSDKFLRLNKALSSVLPVGESYNLQFAQPIVST